ncbi:MAG: Hpt domain-containing protein [Magnetococcus sp. YQC-5]
MGMDPEKRARHQEKIQKLYHSYRERMAVELVGLGELASRLEGTEGDREVLMALRQQLHTIAGSGGTFGQVGLGEQARFLELTLVSWLNAPLLELNTEERHRLAESLAALPGMLIDTDAIIPSK